MVWLKDLYMGEKAEKKKGNLLRRIRQSYLVPGAYVIALAENRDDLLDIIPAVFLVQKYYTELSNLKIIGLGAAKDETMNLLIRILEDVKNATGGYDVQSYFSAKEFE